MRVYTKVLYGTPVYKGFNTNNLDKKGYLIQGKTRYLATDSKRVI